MRSVSLQTTLVLPQTVPAFVQTFPALRQKGPVFVQNVSVCLQTRTARTQRRSVSPQGSVVFVQRWSAFRQGHSAFVQKAAVIVQNDSARRQNGSVRRQKRSVFAHGHSVFPQNESVFTQIGTVAPLPIQQGMVRDSTGLNPLQAGETKWHFPFPFPSGASFQAGLFGSGQWRNRNQWSSDVDLPESDPYFADAFSIHAAQTRTLEKGFGSIRSPGNLCSAQKSDPC